MAWSWFFENDPKAWGFPVQEQMLGGEQLSKPWPALHQHALSVWLLTGLDLNHDLFAAFQKYQLIYPKRNLIVPRGGACCP
jgi:hypothetical protein